MTSHQAKAILSLYRPGTADTEDPDFAEALTLCEQDTELKQWFDEHCTVYNAIRANLRTISVPEGLKEQILAERPALIPPEVRPEQRNSTVRAVLAIGSLAVLIVLLALQWIKPPEDTGFSGFRSRMIGTALRLYGMDLESDNLDRIRQYLAERKTIADYVLPPALEAAKPAGCMATTWQGQPVAMICFRTGRPLAPGQMSDLWLFVTRTSAVAGAPASPQPNVIVDDSIASASWSENGRTYVLVTEGDASVLKKFL